MHSLWNGSETLVINLRWISIRLRYTTENQVTDFVTISCFVSIDTTGYIHTFKSFGFIEFSLLLRYMFTFLFGSLMLPIFGWIPFAVDIIIGNFIVFGIRLFPPLFFRFHRNRNYNESKDCTIFMENRWWRCKNPMLKRIH